MKDLSEMLRAGCHFCKKILTVEAAKCGTMSIKLVGTDVWSAPIAIVCCEDCFKRESEAHH
ncbi:MAG: hypothetical protein JWM11_7778 [Planctomycetaceae bacterium]|nr:hypothetical protein [Planctomycetaceae bacterium]